MLELKNTKVKNIADDIKITTEEDQNNRRTWASIILEHGDIFNLENFKIVRRQKIKEEKKEIKKL